jgi:outer membrane protein OmpA-like peptidoglycan-associated protein
MYRKSPSHVRTVRQLYTLIVIGVICFAGASFHRPARATIPQVCPRISCPTSELVGTPIQFTVDPGSANPTYSWIVSAGTITSGAGGSQITVENVSAGLSCRARVTMSRLPAGCSSTLVCETSVTGSPSARMFDTYGRIARDNEQQQLDNFAVALQNDPGATGYIITYGGRRGPAGEAQTRADSAKNYLMNSRGIDAGRLVTVDGGFREEATTELWLVPSGATPPTASPNVDASEVQTTRRPRRAPRRRRRP